MKHPLARMLPLATLAVLNVGGCPEYPCPGGRKLLVLDKREYYGEQDGGAVLSDGSSGGSSEDLDATPCPVWLDILDRFEFPPGEAPASLRSVKNKGDRCEYEIAVTRCSKSVPEDGAPDSLRF